MQIRFSFLGEKKKPPRPLLQLSPSEWRSRPLNETYAFVYVDLMLRPNPELAYAIGVDMHGFLDIIGVYMFKADNCTDLLLNVFADLKVRGVHDIHFVSIGGMVGSELCIPEAYPAARIFHSVTYLIRDAMTGMANEVWRMSFHENAQKVLIAYTFSDAKNAMKGLMEWEPDFHYALWGEDYCYECIEHQYDLPSGIRRMLCNTNAVEAVRDIMYKMIYSVPGFSNTDTFLQSFTKRAMGIMKKRGKPVSNWLLVLEYINKRG